MKVLLRGATEFREFPDQPTSPVGTTIARGSDAPADTHGTSDPGVARADSASAPAILITPDASSSVPTTVSFAHTDTPVLFGPVASAVVDIQMPTMGRGELGGSGDASGSGDIARGADTLASLSLDGPAYADHGWFIVPSSSNEYGPAYAAAADDFAFDVAAGEFSSDWFWA